MGIFFFFQVKQDDFEEYDDIVWNGQVNEVVEFVFGFYFFLVNWVLIDLVVFEVEDGIVVEYIVYYVLEKFLVVVNKWWCIFKLCQCSVIM